MRCHSQRRAHRSVSTGLFALLAPLVAVGVLAGGAPGIQPTAAAAEARLGLLGHLVGRPAGPRIPSSTTTSPQTPSASFTFGTLDFPRAPESWPEGINDHGDTVGGYGHDLKTLNFPQHGFLVKKNRFRTIDFPGASHTIAVGINGLGTIVGVYLNNSDLQDQHGYKLSGTTFTPIDFPGSTYTQALRINASGQIVGQYGDANGDTHGFLLSNNTFTSIDAPGAVGYTAAFGINTAGDIVGVFSGSDHHDHGFLLKNGVFTTIDFPGSTDSFVTDINDHGLMVGSYGTDDNFFGWTEIHGFLRRSGGTFVALDVPYAGAGLTHADGVNNQKQIVGLYEDTNGFYLGHEATIAG
jgi:probable HAF family extracellular repeat protein